MERIYIQGYYGNTYIIERIYRHGCYRKTYVMERICSCKHFIFN